MQTFPASGALQLAPGDNQVVDLPGSFFRVLTASGGFHVDFDDAGQLAYVEPGLAVYPAAVFSRLRLTNTSAVAVTGIMVAVGFGRYDDNRLQYSGAVAIRAGGSGFTDAAVSVGAVAVQVLAANGARSSGIIRAGAADLWLGPTNAVAAVGLATIPAGGALTIGHVGAVYAIRAAGASDAGIYEETI